jgi:lipoyl(octanoyl) transferase
MRSWGMNKPQIDVFQPEYSKYSWEVEDLGLIPYGEALEIQEQSWKNVKEGANHKIYLLEHPNVITLGRRTEDEHLLMTPEELQENNIELFKVDRGGSATFHGPGQLVGYLICKSNRVGGIHDLVARILRSVSELMNSYGIDADIDEENPGIWTKSEIPRKLAAVGLSNRDGVTKHGFAINIDLPLTGFTAIVPCGLALPVSTMAIETGRRITVEEVKSKITKILRTQLSIEPNQKV